MEEGIVSSTKWTKRIAHILEVLNPETATPHFISENKSEVHPIYYAEFMSRPFTQHGRIPNIREV
jgi:hypothetical protein